MFKSKFARKILAFINTKYPVLVAKARYKKTFGQRLDLKSPRNLNEKILWLSLYSDITEWTRLADKYSVREYVKEKGLSDILIPMYGVWNNVEEIDWEDLPRSFVMKTTNGSGTNLVVTDKDNTKKEESLAKIDKWLHRHNGVTTTEFHYQYIKPRVIAEELLVNPVNVAVFSSTLIDYKSWCFNGKAHYVWACSNRVGTSTEVAMFDRDWGYHPEMSIFTEHYKEQKVLVPKPKNLLRMLEIAEVLSEGFPVVRVDLYNLDGRIYFGEMTFTSLGGQMDFYTKDALLHMGDMVDISSVTVIRNK